ncbi:replication initiator protein A [Bacillus sp. MMSF_3328]|uniref:replication initiator protein A n=1 Tax=Bacillus sp. MMSF_3328 TaxID=3047080 RepID=UPI00273D385D|nr:replication initiator protein A [Bacillus sp. MMSF_3328]
MSKKEIEQGERISGKRVNQDKYMPLYEFLMFDPIYRKMHEKAKILYCFLRNKVSYFEMQTEAHANGVEGTKSYLDKNGDIYILADNTELMYLLNCSEPTLIKYKRELANHGLLFEDPVKDAANRIYVLTPKTLSEQWSYIGEIIELREQTKKEQKEKRKKYKNEKVVGMKKIGDLKNLSHEENQEETVENHGDLKNLSHHDLNNFSHHDLKNLRELESNSLNLESNDFKLDPKTKDHKEKGQGQKVIPIHPSIDFSQIDSSVAYDIYKDLRTGKYHLPHLLTTWLSEEIKRTGNFRADFDLKEVEALYEKYENLIDSDFEPGYGLREFDVLTEAEFAQLVVALYKNGQPVKSSFKKQLEAWFNNKFDFKKADFKEHIKQRNELEEMPY